MAANSSLALPFVAALIGLASCSESPGLKRQAVLSQRYRVCVAQLSSVHIQSVRGDDADGGIISEKTAQVRFLIGSKLSNRFDVKEEALDTRSNHVSEAREVGQTHGESAIRARLVAFKEPDLHVQFVYQTQNVGSRALAHRLIEQIEPCVKD